METYRISASPSDTGRASRLNCGLRRDLGTVRTSASRSTPCASSIATNSAMGCVECPIVRTARCTLRTGCSARTEWQMHAQHTLAIALLLHRPGAGAEQIVERHHTHQLLRIV